jgi:hypothetical protein
VIWADVVREIGVANISRRQKRTAGDENTGCITISCDATTLTDVKGETGAGEGIRTLDPNLGKVVLYP